MTRASLVPETSAPPLPARLAAAILPVALVAFLSSLATSTHIDGWYAHLVKPAFNPPNWVFPVAWTVLYAMIALAAWRLLGARPRVGPSRRGWWLALAAFATQLVLNAAWTPIFFAAHAIGLAVVVCAALFVMILWTIRLSWRFDRAAAWLLAPYAAWVGFATVLTAAVWQLN